jgi:PPOX class probable F420-dependent enzyme
MALGDEKYILLTTFRRDDTPVSTPVWATKGEGDTVCFWTSSGSGKAKRLAHTQRVTVQPCDARGRVKQGSTATEATARVVTGAEHKAIQERVIAKYGAMTKFTKLLGTIGGIVKGKRIPYGDVGVVVTPAAPAQGG